MMTISLNTKKISIFILGVFIFFFIYYPPIFQFNVIYVLSVLSVIYLFFNLSYSRQLLSFRYIVRVIIWNVFGIIYLSIIALANNTSVTALARHQIVWLVAAIPISIAIAVSCIKNDIDEFSLGNILIFVGNIQGFFAILAFLYAPFHQWFVDKYVAYGFDAERFRGIAFTRLDGVAMHLTNYAPLVGAIIFIIAIYHCTFNLKYLLTLPLLLFEVILNSRTALVIAIIGAIYVAVISAKDTKKALRFLGIVVIVLLGLYIVFSNMPEAVLNTNTFQRIKNGFDDLVGFANGQSNMYSDYFTSKSTWQMPQNIFFGNGITIYSSQNNMNVSSDVSYVNYIWMGGIFYLIYIFAYYFHLVKPLRTNEKTRYLYIFLAFAIFVVSVKDVMFISNEYMNLIFMISIVIGTKNDLEIIRNEDC